MLEKPRSLPRRINPTGAAYLNEFYRERDRVIQRGGDPEKWDSYSKDFQALRERHRAAFDRLAFSVDATLLVSKVPGLNLNLAKYFLRLFRAGKFQADDVLNIDNIHEHNTWLLREEERDKKNLERLGLTYPSQFSGIVRISNNDFTLEKFYETCRYLFKDALDLDIRRNIPSVQNSQTLAESWVQKMEDKKNDATLLVPGDAGYRSESHATSAREIRDCRQLQETYVRNTQRGYGSEIVQRTLAQNGKITPELIGYYNNIVRTNGGKNRFARGINKLLNSYNIREFSWSEKPMQVQDTAGIYPFYNAITKLQAKIPSFLNDRGADGIPNQRMLQEMGLIIPT